MKDMTTEELLDPRVKIVAKYPDMVNKVGDMLTGKAIDCEYLANECPHLFRKLSWWEGRKPEDMPEYVKAISTDEVYKFDRLGINMIWFYTPSGVHAAKFSETLTPATEAEYNNYSKTQQQWNQY
jgi:hypothetical protein